MAGPSVGGPTIGGGPSGGRRVSGEAPRQTWFEWREETLELAPTITPADGQAEEVLTPEVQVRRALGIESAKAVGDTRPTLVYFHWPHEDSRNGKLADKICDRVLDDEALARWGMLFRCVQIDMGASDERLTALLDPGTRPSFMVLAGDGAVVGRIDAPSTSSKLAKGLERALKKIPEAWERVQDTIDRQEKLLDEADRLLGQGDTQRALDRIDEVRFSKVRIGKVFDKALAEGMRVATILERERNGG